MKKTVHFPTANTTAAAAAIASSDVTTDMVAATSAALVGTDATAGAGTTDVTLFDVTYSSHLNECRFGELPESVGVNIGISVGFLVVILIVVFGNLFIIVAICTDARLRSPVNLLYISLASADLLVGFAVMPLMLVYQLHGCWPLGWFVCDLWSSLDLVGSFTSIFTLCYIAWDRYMAIAHPLRHRASQTETRSKRVICCLWSASIIILTLSVVLLHGYDCVAMDTVAPGLFVVVVSTVCYYTPVVFMTTCCALLAIALRKNLRLAGLSRHNNELTTIDAATRKLASQREILRKEGRAVRMLTVIMAGFLVCWTPFMILWPLMTFWEGSVALWLYELAAWATYTNSLINPFLYVFSNDKFRSSFKCMILRIRTPP